MTTQTEPLMIATIRIEGVTPLLFGGMIDRNAFPKKSRESHDDYERRTWRERAHASPDGRLYVPALALKRMFESTARQQGDRIKGAGMKTWTSKMRTGLQAECDMALDPATLKNEVTALWKSVPADGKPGGAKRVPRAFPIVASWGGEFSVLLLDSSIQPEILENYARKAGILNGLGTWRPQTGGNFGRFRVTSIQWSELGD